MIHSGSTRKNIRQNICVAASCYIAILVQLSSKQNINYSALLSGYNFTIVHFVLDYAWYHCGTTTYLCAQEIRGKQKLQATKQEPNNKQELSYFSCYCCCLLWLDHWLIKRCFCLACMLCQLLVLPCKNIIMLRNYAIMQTQTSVHCGCVHYVLEVAMYLKVKSKYITLIIRIKLEHVIFVNNNLPIFGSSVACT